MDKLTVIDSIIKHLEEEVDLASKAQRETFDAATDEDAYSDGKYDTRSLESSYLAGGQAQLVKELGQALQGFRLMRANHFIQSPSRQVGLGSLVNIEQGKESYWYMLGPCAGGTDVEVDGQQITVLTLHSPLGRSIAGKSEDDNIQLGGSKAKVVQVV